MISYSKGEALSALLQAHLSTAFEKGGPGGISCVGNSVFRQIN